MMKLLSFAALSYVAAADVPVFSSNDDYDEINLNIRLLQNNATANVTTYVMSGEMSTKYTSANDASAVCDAVKVSTQKTLVSTLKSSSATVDSCADATARRARALQAGEVSIKQGYTAVFASEAGATAAKATVESGSFAADFAAALTTQMASDGVTAASAPTVTSASASAPVTQVNGQTVTAAPAPVAATPAAPSPAPSSDASMLKANVALAAVAAVFASMF
jgi:hypothetical protein